MPGRRNKRLGEGEGVAAVAGMVLNNQWFGLKFQSLRTLVDVEGDGKTALQRGFGSWSLCQHCGPVQTLWTGNVLAQCLSCTWPSWATSCTRSNRTPLPPHESQGKERAAGLQTLLAVATGPSRKERGEVVAAAVSRRRGSWVKRRKERSPSHAEGSLCTSKGLAGGQGKVREGCEEDGHIALQERSFSAISQWAMVDETRSHAS